MKQKKYDKDAVMTIALGIFVISTIVAIFSFNNPFAFLSMISGITFAVLLFSDMVE